MTISTADLILGAAKRIEALLTDGGRDAELTRRQIEVLLILSETPGISQAVILSRSLMDRSTLSAVVRLMSDRGYIKRAADPDDQRADRCTLTAKGHAAAKKATAIKAHVDAEVDKAANAAASFGGRLQAIAGIGKNLENAA